MELEVTHAYDASLEQVLGAFFSEDHILRKNEQVGARNVKVKENSRSDQTGKLVITREVQASFDVPGILASFHREWSSVRQEEHWFRKDDDEWHCEFRVHVDGVPARIKGSMRLQGNQNNCINYLSLNVRCDLPLIGKKVARFLLDDSRAKIEREYQASLALI